MQLWARLELMKLQQNSPGDEWLQKAPQPRYIHQDRIEEDISHVLLLLRVISSGFWASSSERAASSKDCCYPKKLGFILLLPQNSHIWPKIAIFGPKLSFLVISGQIWRRFHMCRFIARHKLGLLGLIWWTSNKQTGLPPLMGEAPVKNNVTLMSRHVWQIRHMCLCAHLHNS